MFPQRPALFQKVSKVTNGFVIIKDTQSHKQVSKVFKVQKITKVSKVIEL